MIATFGVMLVSVGASNTELGRMYASDRLFDSFG